MEPAGRLTFVFATTKNTKGHEKTSGGHECNSGRAQRAGGFSPRDQFITERPTEIIYLEERILFTLSALRPPVACGNTGLHPVPSTSASTMWPTCVSIFSCLFVSFVVAKKSVVEIFRGPTYKQHHFTGKGTAFDTPTDLPRNP